MKKHLYILISVLFLTNFIYGQDATPTPTPSPTAVEKLENVPQIAPNFESDKKDLPDLGLVGVDMTQQKPLTLKEAITLALENNKDIEVTRQNVRIAEFDLQSLRGVYELRLSGQTFYERATVPNTSIFSTNRTTTTGNLGGNVALQGFIPKYGTILSGNFTNNRVASDNSISILSPQYNSSLTLNITQPLFRGRNFDQNRRNIEISKRNLSLTDTQFRQRTIEVITNVQRAYWDLAFALRNLQVQRDGVRDAKEQLAHNKRLVEEGSLAPIDIVAAETQVAVIEQNVYEALENVNRASNILKNLISVNRNDSIWSESIVPTDSVELETPKTTLPEALELALKNRPEIEVNETQKEINSIEQ
ncbi:MAG TPA: TolC family protein, partial [Pyrinomonadaceae bacterium]|nr:TolC family protein [Pyrinomonadaceae bacterium]